MIYLTGYYGHQAEDLQRLAENLSATVVDIRMMPSSRLPGWRQSNLARLLGKRYMHVKAFGNVNYNNEGPIQIADMQAGVRALVQAGQRNYLLLCGCKDAHTCHRTVIGAHLRRLSKDGVREVTPDEWAGAEPTNLTYALSIRQPWAWLIVQGWKDVENRDWRTHRRGQFYVHAGKTFDKQGYQWVRENFVAIDIPKPGEYELGGIVGHANLVDCVEWSESPWFQGEYGFMLSDAYMVPFLPLDGQLNFFRFEYPEPITA